MKSIIVILFIFFSRVLAQTSPQIEWIKLYPMNTGSILILEDNSRDANGNFYLACDVYNTLYSKLKLIKYNKDGELLFEINEVADSSFSLSGFKIAVDSKENIYITGTKKYQTNPVRFSTYLSKYSSAGKMLWNKEYHNGSYPSFVLLDTQENPIVGYYQYPYVRIGKYLSTGDSLWSKSIGTLSGLTKLYVNSDDIYLAAYKRIPNTDPPDQNGFLYKLGNNGETIWFRDSTYGPICFDHNSNIIYRTRGDIVYKIRNNGDFIWRNDSDLFSISNIKADNKNNIIIIGSRYDLTGVTANNYMTKKISENGSLEWVKEFNSVDTDYSRDFIQDAAIDSNSDIYVTGFSQRSKTYCYSIKYNATGYEEFRIKLSDYKNSQFYGSYIYLNSDGSFYIVGHTDSTVFISKIKEPIANTVLNQFETKLNFSLSQNFPNPFNPSTTINYSVSRHSVVQIKVFDLLGQEVAELVNREEQPGNYKVEFDGRKLASGVYFYQLKASNFEETKKFVLLK